MNNNIFSIPAVYDITGEEAAEAISKVMKQLPPLGEDEISMIKRNPNLNFFDKWRLIRDIKKQISERENKNDK